MMYMSILQEFAIAAIIVEKNSSSLSQVVMTSIYRQVTVLKQQKSTEMNSIYISKNHKNQFSIIITVELRSCLKVLV